MMQWDGTKFQIVSNDWVAPPDPAFIRKLIEDSAAKYAAENNITPRECSLTASGKPVRFTGRVSTRSQYSAQGELP